SRGRVRRRRCAAGSAWAARGGERASDRPALRSLSVTVPPPVARRAARLLAGSEGVFAWRGFYGVAVAAGLLQTSFVITSSGKGTSRLTPALTIVLARLGSST